MARRDRQFLETENWITAQYDSPVQEEALKLQAQYDEQEEKRQKARQRRQMLGFLTIVFSVLLVFSIFTIILDGFNIGGFEIPESIHYLLISTTVGSVAGLLTITIKSLFEK